MSFNLERQTYRFVLRKKDSVGRQGNSYKTERLGTKEDNSPKGGGTEKRPANKEESEETGLTRCKRKRRGHNI